MGRNSQNKVLVFPKISYDLKPGDYTTVHATNYTQAALLGEIKNQHDSFTKRQAWWNKINLQDNAIEVTLSVWFQCQNYQL